MHTHVPLDIVKDRVPSQVSQIVGEEQVEQPVISEEH
jgi:hypothetical protein